jgi:hypothetical protein
MTNATINRATLARVSERPEAIEEEEFPGDDSEPPTIPKIGPTRRSVRVNRNISWGDEGPDCALSNYSKCRRPLEKKFHPHFSDKCLGS